MAVIPQSSLFSWTALEARSDLDRLGLVLENLPDQQIVRYLEVMRGNGRDDFPVAPMWNALLAGVVFQHPSIEALCRELSRNPALVERCGFDPLPRQPKPESLIDRDGPQAKVVYLPAALAETAAPKPHNFSRFLRNLIELEECLGLISGLMPRLREELIALLPDFGAHQGYDGKGIESHSTGQRDRTTGQTSDPDADWGKHETHGVDANGKAWTKIKSWLGYGLDRRHPLRTAPRLRSRPGFPRRITDAAADDPGSLCRDPGVGRALFHLQRRPRSRLRRDQGDAVG